MSFLNTEQLTKEIQQGNLIVPFRKERIEQGAY